MQCNERLRPTRCTYTGREFDTDTGLMYYRARWYDPQQGRFISEDPIGFLGRDINLYGYVRNNPSRFNDPTGLRRCNPILGAILGGLLGGAGGAGGGAIVGAGISGTTGLVLGLAGGPAGSVILGGGGLAAGAITGAVIGSAVGVGVGIGVGIDYCSGDDDDSKTCDNDSYPRAVPNPTPRTTPVVPPAPPGGGDKCVDAYEACLGWANQAMTSGERRLRRRLCSKAFDECKRGGVTVKFPDGTVVR